MWTLLAAVALTACGGDDGDSVGEVCDQGMVDAETLRNVATIEEQPELAAYPAWKTMATEASIAYDDVIEACPEMIDAIHDAARSSHDRLYVPETTTPTT